MEEKLLTKCEQFIENRDRIKGEVGWESAYVYPISALIYLSADKPVDPSALRDCMNLLKQKTGFFSSFRSTLRLPICALIATAESPQQRLADGLAAYQSLNEKFWNSTYLPVASMIIAQMATPSEYSQLAQRTRDLYDRMKAEHPFLTSTEDSAFAALLALSPKGDREIVEEMEACYQQLKPQFFSGNSVQSLSHALALVELPTEEKCRRTMDLYNLLKSRGRKYGTSYELPTLGILALSGDDTEALADRIITVDDWLSRQKGFGLFGLGSRQRLMYAGMIATELFSPAALNGVSAMQAAQATALSATISMVAAQQAAMCAAVAASAAAASSSSSN